MNKQEAQDLLPWFVAGSLSEDESRAVQAFIDSGEITAEEMDELALFAEAVQEQTASEPAYKQEILQGVMAQLDAVPQDTLDEPVVVKEPKQESWLQNLLARLQWAAMPPVAKVALAGQFALVLALGALVVMQDSGGAFYGGEVISNTVSNPNNVGVADVQISMAPGATEAQFRALLTELDAQVVAGPNSLGIYDVDLAEGTDIDAALTELRNNAQVNYVSRAAQ